ncbi:MAG: DUF3138 family protein [Piscinibacter sp.]|uniref:DUF3138 family protein n=1 Tax=Piscinibacter TaxID=1114981 RepID=UPI000FDDB26A|nr:MULTISPECIES: DUF3138 family protein [Piscinibacter]MCW5664145.1 DUF3138 family protein [Piscinibacter sp.]
MRTCRPSALAQAAALALGAAFSGGAAAQSAADLLKEIQALKARVAELEAKQKSAAEAKPAAGQWGMTPEQAQEFNRIAVKTEALEDAMEAQGFKGLKITGQMDPTYIYNRNQNRSGFQVLNKVSDDGYNYDNSYFGMAMIDFLKETQEGTRWRLTLAPNRGVGSAFDPDSVVHEASVSVPLTDLQTRFIAGQIPDWSGYEYLQPTLNKLITHNLLFDFTLPTAYTGAGLEITSGKWIVKGVLANLNASRNGQGEKAPVFAYRVDYSRGEFQGFGFAGVHGKAANFSENVLDENGDPIAQRNSRVDLFEFDAYFIRGDFTWQGQLSYGQQKKASITPAADGSLRTAKWYGLTTLVAYKFIPRYEAIARFDYLNNKKNGGGLLGYTSADDRNGIGPDPSGDPDTGANRMALSLGMSYLYNLNTVFKVEYRLDRATQPVFLDVKDNSYRKNNQMFGTSVVLSF